MNCDHYIGMWLNYDNTDLVTKEDVRLHVEHLTKMGWCKYKLEDYFDKRKTVNLIRFDYCPNCGEKLDWRKMKHDR